MSILLIGFMGAGKSTVGRLLAEQLAKPFRDLDQLVEEMTQKTILQLFEEGEEVFREAETKALIAALGNDQVIACGGGIILKEANQALLQAHPQVVYLKGQPDALFRRIQKDEANVRPLATEKTAAEMQEILAPRLPLYQSAASIEVETTGKAPQEIVQEIVERLEL
ncbi:shikimate kinase [Enterococcus asini]|uniref:shikimate kinase n=1 Tax=Enterococcus asini TaxID=57732 RepID=UPI00266B41B7|nr:shikimate kinase [Enterococcus asini]